MVFFYKCLISKLNYCLSEEVFNVFRLEKIQIGCLGKI
jgi:hypothetical protein